MHDVVKHPPPPTSHHLLRQTRSPLRYAILGLSLVAPSGMHEDVRPARPLQAPLEVRQVVRRSGQAVSWSFGAMRHDQRFLPNKRGGGGQRGREETVAKHD